jgi:hypothetical protein
LERHKIVQPFDRTVNFIFRQENTLSAAVFWLCKEKQLTGTLLHFCTIPRSQLETTTSRTQVYANTYTHLCIKRISTHDKICC